MSEYVPTTEQVRQFWASEGTYVPAAKSEDYVVSAVEFDRWLDQSLAVARREGQAEAWEAGAQAQAAAYGMDKDTGPNPYLEDRHVDQ